MSASDPKAAPAGPPRFIGLAVAGAAVLVLIGGAAFYLAAQRARPAAADAFRVTITARACAPNALTVPAGRRKFEVVNASDRPVEWEILDGVMVVAEQENIVPGLKATLTVDLQPGALAMTCGLLSNPRGTLTVTPSRESAVAAASAPTMRAFLGPLAEYRFYLGMAASALDDGARRLADAIRAGDVAAARTAYEAARAPYKQLETVVYRFSDLVDRINPSPDYLAGREADPAFTGFHRIAYDLYGQNGVGGLQPFADQLAADAADLKARLRSAKLAPADLVGGAARLARQLASGRIASGEDSSSRTDLDDLDANLASIGKIVELFAPVVRKSAADAADGAERAVAGAQSVLAGLRDGDRFKSFDAVDASTRAALAETFGTLADALDRLGAAVEVRS